MLFNICMHVKNIIYDVTHRGTHDVYCNMHVYDSRILLINSHPCPEWENACRSRPTAQRAHNPVSLDSSSLRSPRHSSAAVGPPVWEWLRGTSPAAQEDDPPPAPCWGPAAPGGRRRQQQDLKSWYEWWINSKWWWTTWRAQRTCGDTSMESL